MAFPGEPGAVHMAVSPAPRATRGLPAGLGPPRTLVATCHAACWSPEPLDRAVRSGSTSFLQSRGDGAVQTLAVLGRWPTSLPVPLPPAPRPCGGCGTVTGPVTLVLQPCPLIAGGTTCFRTPLPVWEDIHSFLKSACLLYFNVRL